MNVPLQDKKVLQAGDPDLWFETPDLSISVGELADSVRAGDLYQDSELRVSAVEGIRTHQKVQNGRRPPYVAEQSIKARCRTELGIIEIRGRMDGWVPAADGIPPWIEEIKTSRRQGSAPDLSLVSIHTAQLKLYAWMTALAGGCEHINAQLTFIHPDSLSASPVRFEWHIDELAQFATTQLQAFVDRAMREEARRGQRDRRLSTLAYPMAAFRPGQRALASVAYKAIVDATHQTWLEAPTGLGKTLGILYPALRAMPVSDISRVFYFTAKVQGQNAAEEALQQLRGSEALPLASVTITAKRAACPTPELPCDPAYCPRAKGFYDRLGEGLVELREAGRHHHIDRSTIARVSDSHALCPFELNLEFARESDVVVADFNYGFDPRVRLQRLLEQSEAKPVFLIDEAHNLLTRSVDMFSNDLRLATLKDAQAIRANSGHMDTALNKLISELQRLVSENPQDTSWVAKPEAIQTVVSSASDWLITMAAENDSAKEASILEAWWDTIRFVECFQSLTDDYEIIVEQSPETRILLACVQPGQQLQAMFDSARSIVAFSGTLRPKRWFEARLATPSDAAWIGFPSPFPPDHQFTAVVHDIDVRYHQRSHSMPRLVRLIHEVTTAKRGHYLIFCPSFEFLYQVAAHFEAMHPMFKTVTQGEGDTLQAIQAFRNAFTSSEPTVGFAITGGRFAESIDFSGDQLIGVVIIGLGLAPRSTLSDVISERTNEEGRVNGFDAGYRYPALMRTVQTAGRVIRSASDRGVVLLVDHRFRSTENLQHAPPWWDVKFTPSHAIQPALADFWREQTSFNLA